MPTPHEAFAVLTRLDVAIECRAKLLEKRDAMIAQFRRTGQKADRWEFSHVENSLKINQLTIDSLQAALKALGVAQ